MSNCKKEKNGFEIPLKAYEKSKLNLVKEKVIVYGENMILIRKNDTNVFEELEIIEQLQKLTKANLRKFKEKCGLCNHCGKCEDVEVDIQIFNKLPHYALNLLLDEYICKYNFYKLLKKGVFDE